MSPRLLVMALAGLVIWCGVLSGAVYALYQQSCADQLTIYLLDSDLRSLKTRTLMDEAALKNTRSQLKVSQKREHLVEEVLAEMIKALTEPDDKPSSAPSKYDQSQSGPVHSFYREIPFVTDQK